MLKIAITGNIASGKTVVLDFFKNDGIKTLCLDEVCHKVYENNDVKSKLIKEFGTANRSEISKIIFDNGKIKLLEEILSPYIYEQMNLFFIKNKDEKYIIAAVPQLFESNYNKYFDKIIFISSKEEIRLIRLKIRNNLNDIEAKKRIEAQLKEEYKIKKSDYILYNNDDIKSLKTQYLKLKEELDTL